MEIIVILEKNGKYVTLAKDLYKDYDLLGQYDSKNNSILRKKISNPNRTDLIFSKQLELAESKGWKVVYYGERLSDGN